MIWAKEETLPRAEIEKIQLEKLKQTVHYIYERVEPYRRKMEDAGVKPEDIQSLDDLKKLPFTYKADFRDNYPMGLFAVDKKDLVRFHASSGTTGKPTVVGYTRKDLDVWLGNVARIACMGQTKLRRTFKQACGCTIVEYRQRLRCAKAAELLAAGDAPVAQVAAAVGYRPERLAELFARTHHTTPSAYRAAMR